MPIGDEAINVFMGLPGEADVLELTYNHGVDSYEHGTGYNHIALSSTTSRAPWTASPQQGIEPEKPPYRPGGRTEGPPDLLRQGPRRVPNRADRDLNPGDIGAVEPLAVSKGVAIAYGIGLWVVLIVAPATITALKGQWAPVRGRLAHGGNGLVDRRPQACAAPVLVVSPPLWPGQTRAREGSVRRDRDRIELIGE